MRNFDYFYKGCAAVTVACFSAAGFVFGATAGYIQYNFN